MAVAMHWIGLGQGTGGSDTLGSDGKLHAGGEVSEGAASKCIEVEVEGHDECDHRHGSLLTTIR